jgi:hypothetical protein
VQENILRDGIAEERNNEAPTNVHNLPGPDGSDAFGSFEKH